MIKNKKYTHTKGGRIEDFDFDNDKKQKNTYGVTKQYIYFNLKLIDGKIGNFKISQHTFAHFDEFENSYLNSQIQNFRDIMQYFAVFIFLLNSMNLTNTNFKNPDGCPGKRTKDDTCYIKKVCTYNLDKEDLTIYINKNISPIFITSLFPTNRKIPKKDSSKLLKNINNIELKNTKNPNVSINFSENTINKLLQNQQIIMDKDYDITYILDLLKDDYTDVSTSKNLSPSPTLTSPSRPKQKTSSNPILPIEYHFSIPKNSGGKKHKTKSSKTRRNKIRCRKTRKSRKSI